MSEGQIRIWGLRENQRKFSSPSSSSSKCVSGGIKDMVLKKRFRPFTDLCSRQVILSVNLLFLCVCVWAVMRFFSWMLAPHLSHDTFLASSVLEVVDSDPDLWTVELFFCLSVAGGKTAGTRSCMWLLMLRCCVLLFGAGVDFYRNIQRCYCTWTRVFGCCRVGFLGGGRVSAASAPRSSPPPTRKVKFSVYLHISKASAKDWWLFI